MLIGAANVSGEHLQDHAVLGCFARWIDQFGKWDGLNFDLALAQVNNTAIS